MANPLTVSIGTKVNFMIDTKDADGNQLPGGTAINTSSSNGNVAQPVLDFHIATGQIGQLLCPVSIIGVGTAVLTATGLKPDGTTGSGSATLNVTAAPGGFSLVVDLVTA